MNHNALESILLARQTTEDMCVGIEVLGERARAYQQAQAEYFTKHKDVADERAKADAFLVAHDRFIVAASIVNNLIHAEHDSHVEARRLVRGGGSLADLKSDFAKDCEKNRRTFALGGGLDAMEG